MLVCVLASLRAGEALKPDDVVAFIGGTNTVAADEFGYFETILAITSKDRAPRVRSFAWEADTVYEHPRDVGFPTIAQQLDKAGATVVIAEFGACEALDGAARVEDFAKAYDKLLAALAKPGRRFVLQ